MNICSVWGKKSEMERLIKSNPHRMFTVTIRQPDEIKCPQFLLQYNFISFDAGKWTEEDLRRWSVNQSFFLHWGLWRKKKTLWRGVGFWVERENKISLSHIWHLHTFMLLFIYKLLNRQPHQTQVCPYKLRNFLVFGIFKEFYFRPALICLFYHGFKAFHDLTKYWSWRSTCGSKFSPCFLLKKAPQLFSFTWYCFKEVKVTPPRSSSPSPPTLFHSPG